MIFNMALSKEELIKLKLEYENEKEGKLGYYDCPICRNKGVVYFEHLGEIQALQCDCVTIRKMALELEQCGVRKEIFERYKLDTFETPEEWQVKVKGIFTKYLTEFKNDKDNFKNWLVISAQSGSGKSHLCTAILKEMIINGKKGKYLLWRDEVPKLLVLKKSVHIYNQEKYDRAINELKNVDILYIDDLLKNYNEKKLEELDFAYEIINNRYINNKITIISSELSKEQLEELDVAICGRINEKCKGYWVQLKYEKDRNYRMKDRRE